MNQVLLSAILFLQLPLHSVAQVASTASDLGILQLVTPTTHASLVQETALLSLTVDAETFYASYIDIDTFNYASAVETAIHAIATNPTLGPSLAAQENILATVYFDAATSLLQNPTQYLTRLASAASPWPFSSQLMSQASGILLGYESIVSVDILGKSASSVTPGMSINVAPGPTAAAGSGMATNSMGATGTGPATATSKAGGAPVATANAQLVLSAMVAAGGVFGMALL